MENIDVCFTKWVERSVLSVASTLHRAHPIGNVQRSSSTLKTNKKVPEQFNGRKYELIPQSNKWEKMVE